MGQTVSPADDDRLENIFPETAARRLARPFARFLAIESASGVLLLVCAFFALAAANSPWAASYAAIWETPFGISFGGAELRKPLLLWINDGLMTIFFFVVGLEIKREIVNGELRDPKNAALPVMAALGGMVAPALIYLGVLGGQPGQDGWGIPMATDIAFVVGFLALLGSRVPVGLKIFLLSLAIVDDIGAVLVIAVAYTSDISITALLIAAAGFAVVLSFNWLGVRPVSVYFALGAVIWVAVLKSGVHPTVAGVLLGMLTPARPLIDESARRRVIQAVLRRSAHTSKDADHGESHDDHHRYTNLQRLEATSRETVSPLVRLETDLHPWVAFGIMPLFALANAGVRLDIAAIGSGIAMAVATGLVLGKPVGVVLFSWLAVKMGIARLPRGVNWKIIVGAGCLAGIGFTMSLFIAGLALPLELLYAGKIGTLLGSLISAILGCSLLVAFLPKPGVESANGIKEEAAETVSANS